METDKKRTFNESKDVYVHYGNLIQMNRRKKKLSQAKVAEKLCVSKNTISHIENGVRAPTPKVHRQLMEMFGLGPLGYDIVFMNDTEYYGYVKSKDLRDAFSRRDFSGIKTILAEVEGKEPFTRGTDLQCVSFYNIVTNESKTPNEKIAEIKAILEITNPGFELDKIGSDPLSRDEVTMLCEIAEMYNDIGDFDNAISVLNGVVASMEKYYGEHVNQQELYPLVLSNLALYYGRNNRHEQVRDICEKNIRVHKSLQSVKSIPYLLFFLASAWLCLGSSQKACEPLIGAYYLALNLEEFTLSNEIKIDAKSNFSIDFDRAMY